jgi:hypothetical protein
MLQTVIVAAAASALACASVAGASEADTSMFSIHSYGTLALTHSSEDQADFVVGIQKPDGAGLTHSWDWGVDSKVALQIDARFTEKLSAVVQGVSERRYDGDYGPDLEWANLKYQITPDLSVRVGRVVMPFLMLSDFRKVGYATPWVRPPVDVYGQIPINNTDGVDISYTFRIGEISTTVQGIYGEISGAIPIAKFSIKNMIDVNASIVRGPLTLRLGYFQQDLSAYLPTEPLFNGFRDFGGVLASIPAPSIQAVGAQAFAIHDKYQSIDKLYRLIDVGITYDDGKWLALAEWALARAHSVVRDTTAWYGTLGRRIGPFTPYLSFARQQEDSAKSDPGLTVTALPPGPLSDAANGLNAALNGALAFITTGQKTATVGLRWDFMRSTALKLQYDRVSLDPGSAGFFVNVQPGFQRGGDVDVVSAAVDYAF